MLPSWKTSPAMLSTAKSSLTRADDLVLRLQQHLVVGVVGDRAAGGQRGQPRAAPAAQHVVDGVVMDAARRAGRAACWKPSASIAHDGGEILARQRAIGPGAAEQRDRARPRSIPAPPTSATICCASTSSGCSGIVSRSSSPRRDAVEQRRALDQLVARQREQAALGRAVDRMPERPTRCRKAGDRARRAELADQIDLADVDAELQRGGRHQRLQLRRASAAVRRRAAAPWRGCRGARSPDRRSGAPTAGGSPARPGGGC